MISFMNWFFWTIFLYVGHVCGSLGCLEEEKIGLLKLKQEFNASFSTWGGHQSDCCLWECVKCDPTSKRVLELSLDRAANVAMGLNLNMSLFQPFQKLKNLSLSYNELTGFTGELKSSKLQYLYLSGNQLQEIPSFLMGHESLKQLFIQKNFNRNETLSKAAVLTSLSSLETLNLDNGYHINYVAINNPFIGALAADLKSLFLGGNILNSTILETGVCMLKNLEELDLSRCGLFGIIPSCLRNLTSLKILKLSENNLVGNIPSTLFSNFKSLVHVSLSYNHFQGSFSFNSSLSLNSKLEAFELNSHNSELIVDTENPPWTPLCPLKVLGLSNCKLNLPSSVVPSFLLHQQDLRAVHLSHNGMTGNVPTWILLNNTKLVSLSLRGNFFTGPFLLHPNSSNPNMERLDVSENHICGELPHFIGSIFPDLFLLNMSSNWVRGLIPPTLGNMRHLLFLDLSNNNFSGEIPEHLSMGCTSLNTLKLSNNNLQGPLLPPRSNLTGLSELYLDSNNFSGELPRALLKSSLWFLDISHNFIFGKLPNWFGNLGVESLDLSNNLFDGHLPKSLCNLKRLDHLDLSKNKFDGLLPSCFNETETLSHLHLHKNNFTGPFPHFLSGMDNLVTLDMRDNNFFGQIPNWVASLTKLRVLLLKHNNFSGPIPNEICDLKYINILDISWNRFEGLIPSCLSHIPFSTKKSYRGSFQYGGSSFGLPETDWEESESESAFESDSKEELVEFMTKGRNENYSGDILNYMTGIDLSRNELEGNIPNELGNMVGIHALNLSHNRLTGSIPTTLSNMKGIESLDLSHNKLSGHIPSELTQLNFLSSFSVAYNNLSGTIPDKQQFTTFDSSCFEGNPLLRGRPLQKSCAPTENSPLASMHDNNDSLTEAFLWALMISYVGAFSGVVSFLYYSGYYRYKLFYFVEAKTGLPLCSRD